MYLDTRIYLSSKYTSGHVHRKVGKRPRFLGRSFFHRIFIFPCSFAVSRLIDTLPRGMFELYLPVSVFSPVFRFHLFFYFDCPQLGTRIFARYTFFENDRVRSNDPNLFIPPGIYASLMQLDDPQRALSTSFFRSYVRNNTQTQDTFVDEALLSQRNERTGHLSQNYQQEREARRRNDFQFIQLIEP